MLKIVLVCGGTGSIAIQRGFSCLYGYKNYQLDVVINAYDNGKSTGTCRKVFDRKILGPSDLRKNQLTQFEIVYHDEIADPQSSYAKLLDLFELRITEKSYKEYFEKAYGLIAQSEFLSQEIKDIFLSWLIYFFFEDYNERKWRKTVQKVDFADFSLSNIFYASCAAQHGNSLAEAGRIMSGILKIDNRVHLISDVNLFLKARTERGNIIDDEGDIVTWHNPEDRIIEAILETEQGTRYLPTVDENGEGEITRLIHEADIILFSSGTQWSSLIPTYMHKGFYNLIQQASAKKYLVMNNVEDEDMRGCGAEDVLSAVGAFLPLQDITIVLNDQADPPLRQIDSTYRQIHGELSEPGSRKHIPKLVAQLIMEDYFPISSDVTLISDLDGTLWDENGDDYVKKVGVQNMELFRGTIFSGNNFEHVRDITERWFVHHGGERIYCDYGATYFTIESPHGIAVEAAREYWISSDLVAALKRDSFFGERVTLRGGAVVTLKPILDRAEKLKDLQNILAPFGDAYCAAIAGRTSIDIMRKDFSKSRMLASIIESNGWDSSRILYIGNELQEGNEVCIREMGIPFLQVEDVFEMNLFLKTFFRASMRGKA